MFDKFFEILANAWDSIKPMFIITEYEGGVLLRGGRYRKTVTSGVHFKIPILDDYHSTVVVPTTMPLPPQSLTTQDGKSVVVKATVKYEISDVKTFLLEVTDAIDAISDMTQGTIKDAVLSRTFEEGKSIDDEITKKARVEAKRWGIAIIKVTVTNYGTIKSIRLFSDNTFTS